MLCITIDLNLMNVILFTCLLDNAIMQRSIYAQIRTNMKLKPHVNSEEIMITKDANESYNLPSPDMLP